MNYLNICGYISSLLIINSTAFATTCADENPQGPAAVITCAATLAGFNTAEEFWNQKLFSPITLDGYCKKGSAASFTTAQSALYNLSCTSEAGSYFSYKSFIEADNKMKQKLGNNYNFMRNTSYALNTAELANFLATAALETTGNGVLPIKYQQDGLYFRSEYSYLAADTCFTYPANPKWTGEGKVSGTDCGKKSLEDYYTNYYPLSTYAVAVKNNATYTQYVFDQDAQYNLDVTPMTVTFSGWPNLYTAQGGTVPPPAGYTWQYMNNTIKKGYWIGNGNLQLTGVAMTQFFGWYYQNLADVAPVQAANFDDFVATYLKDGKLAWLGGLFYWNVRIQGYGKPTLHTVLTNNNKPACHDIGVTTYLINGGCNNDNERVLYYKYYKTNVFKQSSEGVSVTIEGKELNSMVCSQDLSTYCSTS